MKDPQPLHYALCVCFGWGWPHSTLDFNQIKCPNNHLHISPLSPRLCRGVWCTTPPGESPISQNVFGGTGCLDLSAGSSCAARINFFLTQLFCVLAEEKKKEKFTFLLHYTSQRRLVMTAHMTPMLCCGKCLSAIHCVSADRTCHRVFRCAESFLTLAPSLLSHRHIHAVETFCACSLNSVQFVRE